MERDIVHADGTVDDIDVFRPDSARVLEHPSGAVAAEQLRQDLQAVDHDSLDNGCYESGFSSGADELVVGVIVHREGAEPLMFGGDVPEPAAELVRLTDRYVTDAEINTFRE